MAAVRGGLSGITVDPDDAGPDDIDASNVARIAPLAVDEPLARGWALFSLALDQALAPIARRNAGPLRVWLVGPLGPDAATAVTKAITNRLRVVPIGVEHVGGHGSSALFAVEKALAALGDGSLDLALVAGCDVRTDAASLAAGVAAERIIGPHRTWGYVPGEAGVAILLASDRAVQRLGLRSPASLLAVASGSEPNPHGSTAPCIGSGLTDVIRRTLAALPPDASASRVLCDLNGERHRSDEWGFTVPRMAGRLRDPGDFIAPATAWGDCGAANGLLLLGLAAGMARGEDADSYALVWTSADGPERAAALVRLPGRPAAEPAPSAAKTKFATPPWAKELDRDILAEMVDECGFRYGQRAFQLAQAAADEPPPDWGQIERTEEMLDSLAVGLAECGEPAWECARVSAVPAAPGKVYVAARVLLEDARNRDAIAFATEQLSAGPGAETELLDAYLHTQRPRNPKDDRVAALFGADPALAWLSLQVAASAGLPPPAAWLTQLAPSVPTARGQLFLGALGRIGDPSARPHLARWHGSSEPTARREAALADILLSGEEARRSVLGRADTDNALLLPAALIVDARGAARLLSRAKAAADVEAVLAVAMAGDASAVPWLLDQLGSSSTARTAAAALEILLGVACFEEHTAADEDETAPPRRARRVSCWRSDWEPAATRVLASHPRAARLRGGVPASRAAAIALLERPHLPPLVRRYLGHELALRWGTARSFDATAPLRVQRAWLASAQRPGDPEPPGSWNAR
jgi:hypothetical protein